MIDSNTTITKCPECGMKRLFWNKERGEVICRSCGYVIEDKMVDFGQDWRESGESDEGEKGRAGAPISYLQPGLTTEVGNKADMYKVGNRSKFYRLRLWQKRTANSIEQNLNHALSELKKVSSFLKLNSHVEEEAARIYTQALQKGLIKGRGVERMVAGAIFAACKIFESPKTLHEISSASSIEEKDIVKSYKFLIRMLNIKVIPVNPISFVAKFGSELGLSQKAQTKAVDYIEKAMKKGITSGKSPNSIAAAALYVSSLMNKEKRTQLKFAETAKITEVTLRNRFNELIDELGVKVKID
jgi:transcription initiation factor TFIIB